MRCISFCLLCLICSCQERPNGAKPFPSATSGPTVLAEGVISTAESHESINAISDHNDTLYFSRSDKSFLKSSLYFSSFVDGKWQAPAVLPFSGTYYDAGMAFSPDKSWAFFTSKRPHNSGELSKAWNIWRIQSKNNDWNSPEVLPYPINSDSLECCLTMNDQGDVFFASNRAGSWDIYEAKYANQHFDQVSKLSEAVNSPKGEWPSFINQQGTRLIFSSVRAEGLGGDDLYVSQKKGGAWSSPLLLPPPLNSTSYEDNPVLAYDEQTLLFSSWRETSFSSGISNIYYVDWPARIVDERQ